MRNSNGEPGLGLNELPSMEFRHIYGMPTRTSDNSSTTPSEAVKEIPESETIHNIAQSDNLWENLKTYGRTVWEGVPSRTCKLPEDLKPSTVHPFPSAQQQKRSARTLDAWNDLYLALVDESLGASCELSIQDESALILSIGIGSAIRVCITLLCSFHSLHSQGT